MTNPNKFALAANNLCPRIKKQPRKEILITNKLIKQTRKGEIPGNNDQFLKSFDPSVSICSLQHKQTSYL